jgi:hypothetical protein
MLSAPASMRRAKASSLRILIEPSGGVSRCARPGRRSSRALPTFSPSRCGRRRPARWSRAGGRGWPRIDAAVRDVAGDRWTRGGRGPTALHHALRTFRRAVRAVAAHPQRGPAQLLRATSKGPHACTARARSGRAVGIRQPAPPLEEGAGNALRRPARRRRSASRAVVRAPAARQTARILHHNSASWIINSGSTRLPHGIDTPAHQPRGHPMASTIISVAFPPA